MNIISVENISKSYGDKLLFKDLSFGVEHDDKIGLIGVNGTGKSTLLKILAGITDPEEGNITINNQVRIQYLSQNPSFDENATVIEEVLRGLKRTSTEELWEVEAQAKNILTRLGINDFNAKIAAFSGGQRKRVAMAKVLSQPAELLILDEPTNHIDEETIQWLEDYLASRKTALLLITHDRYFLERVVNRIIELDRGRLYSFQGNYETFLQNKLGREQQMIVDEQKRQNLLRRELAWLNRGAKARSTKQKAHISRIEALKNVKVEMPSSSLEITIPCQRLGKKVIELHKVSKSYDQRQLLKDFDYILHPQERLGIIGPNGQGKSTLLNIMAGRVQQDSGEVVVGETVRLGYYTQENVDFNPNITVLDYIQEESDVIRTKDGKTISAAQMLEKFLFPPNVQWSPLAKLSGGEQRRIYLLRILMNQPNVLLLDEPTNDLDLQTLTILEEYLDEFEGAVVIVSHDRYFLDRTVDHVLAFENGEINKYLGGYSDYLQLKKEQKVKKEEKPKTAADNRTRNAVNVKLSYNEQREYDSIEGEIEKLEAALTKIEEEIAASQTDYVKLQEYMDKKDELEEQLLFKMERWEYLNEKNQKKR